MNLAIILESLKFYKLRHDRTVQIGFILLYGLNLLPLVLPVGDRDFSRYAGAIGEMLAGSLPDQGILEILTPGNWLILGLMLMASLINSFFLLLYAALYAGESESLQPLQTSLRCLAAIPRLLLLGLLLLIPAILSACLAFLPLLVFAVMMYFLPLNLSLNRLPLAEAMRQSYESTRGKRFSIFAQVILISLLITLPQNLVESLIPNGDLPYAFITTFFTVLRAFVQGRLMGILYLVLVKKAPVVLTSRTSQPNDQQKP